MTSAAICHAAEPTPARVFFSDAKLSFVIPEAWEPSPTFPFGPLFTRITQEGTQAFIACQISDPVDPSRLSADVSPDRLKDFATQDVATHAASARILSASARTLAGQNAYEVTWETKGPEGTMQYQSIYFFVDNHYSAVSLRAGRDSFPWLVPDYQNWLGTIRLLSRRDSGALDSPAHGGFWIHQTAGAKITIPEGWLVGVADDRQLGVAMARDKMHVSFTATVETLGSSASEINPKEKQEARRLVEKKGYTVTAETEEPFHGFPAFQLTYEGKSKDRFVRGQDLWVASPEARWLVNVEGDAPLLRQMAGEVQDLLNNIHFL